jgi:hypothetical protein
MTDVSEFQRESYRIDQQIWDALALRPNDRAFFLGLPNEGAWVARAVGIGVDVTVLAATSAQLDLAERLGATVMRGSATMIPASEGAYDVAIAMHYLHEIDPGFHAQVVSELARVGRRVAIVEPSPPADVLGKRIASLYARAKRENGQFESYQPIEYWRKLLAIAKAEVWQNLFTFARVPPKAAVAETVSLILDAMAIEEMPQAYLDELRALAARHDAQLLPLSRIVLVGTAAGEPLPQGSGSAFRVDPSPPSAVPQRTPVSVPPAAPAPPLPVPDAPLRPRDEVAKPASQAPPAGVAASPPGFDRPPAPPPAPSTPPPPATGAAPPPFGAPFSLPEDAPGEEPSFGAGTPGGPRTGFGWAWEPPELEDQAPDR